MIDNTQMDQLFTLLEQAERLSADYTGGNSNNFLSAEEFHAALTESIQKLKQGDNTQVKRLWTWFAPTCAWDDFIGMEGVGLANEIFKLLCEMIKE